jgi:hypothetical protein
MNERWAVGNLIIDSGNGEPLYIAGLDVLVLSLALCLVWPVV